MDNITVCKTDECVGCKACLSVCGKNALSFCDQKEKMNVYIDTERCVRCNACKNVCQICNPIDLTEPLMWKQGWATNSVRKQSSSGGFATQIMLGFINDYSYVCACKFENGQFKYSITNDINEILDFSGSKYVKSDPDNIYISIQKLLKDQKRVLFIGLPCHVAGLKKYLGGHYDKQLYTIDLICHGTPSAEIFKLFIWEHGFDICKIKKVKFRVDNIFNISVDTKSIYPIGALDSYSLGFLRGLFYTKNCYWCRYATNKRVSDLTLGDSWGSNLKEEEVNGISLALCQTSKGVDLLLKSNLNLYDVDLLKAVAANHQLQVPSMMPKERQKFFDTYMKYNNVTKAVCRCYPIDSIKQALKGFLISLYGRSSRT